MERFKVDGADTRITPWLLAQCLVWPLSAFLATFIPLVFLSRGMNNLDLVLGLVAAAIAGIAAVLLILARLANKREADNETASDDSESTEGEV